jgi:hypothetical protein
MARVVFLMDRLLRPFGLNGKSVMLLMSNVACAISGVMATRTISTFNDRILTIIRVLFLKHLRKIGERGFCQSETWIYYQGGNPNGAGLAKRNQCPNSCWHLPRSDDF